MRSRIDAIECAPIHGIRTGAFRTLSLREDNETVLHCFDWLRLKFTHIVTTDVRSLGVQIRNVQSGVTRLLVRR